MYVYNLPTAFSSSIAVAYLIIITNNLIISFVRLRTQQYHNQSILHLLFDLIKMCALQVSAPDLTGVYLSYTTEAGGRVVANGGIDARQKVRLKSAKKSVIAF